MSKTPDTESSIELWRWRFHHEPLGVSPKRAAIIERNLIRRMLAAQREADQRRVGAFLAAYGMDGMLADAPLCAEGE